MDEPNSFYFRKLNETELQRTRTSRLISFLSFGRLVSFVLFALFPFILKGENTLWRIFPSLLSLILFLFLVRKNQQYSFKRRLLENLITLNRNELKALEHNFSVFRNGDRFIDPHHINSCDLDLFGEGSLFQYLNRTVTLKGEECLAHLIQNPSRNPESIYRRQELVCELAEDPGWRQSFSASGMMYEETPEESELFDRWGNDSYSLVTFRILPVLLIVLPTLSVASVVYWIITGNFLLFIFSGLVQFSLWMVEKKNTTALYRQFGKRVKVLQKYAGLFQHIESRQWKSAEGIAIIKDWEQFGLPSALIGKLSRLVTTFDNRNNFFVGLFGNLMFLWDIACSYMLLKWHKENKSAYSMWCRSYSLIDALNSLAGFTSNHPGYALPSFREGVFYFSAKNMGHPLIHHQKRVTNSFEIKENGKMVIITGANMAGKSTFLRTVGVNMVLAGCGTVVCASEMVLTPVKVFTNMRTTDSLFNDVSYFFAELKRIRSILDEVEKGIPMLIILDEILKGTNSVDKLSGSEKLLKKLVKKDVPAIIATHDIKLTELMIRHPGSILNYCFEIELEGEEMVFNYRLRPGVTQTMNATFMMKKMGIIDE